MAGHMGKASSPSVCQPTLLLQWQTCPRQDHRRGPPVGLRQGSPASLSPLEHPPTSTSAQEAYTQPWSPLPQDAIAPRPALLHTDITLLFSAVCHVVFVIRAVWRHVFYFYLFYCLCLPCPQAARFQIRLLRDYRFQWCESIFREQIAERPILLLQH